MDYYQYDVIISSSYGGDEELVEWESDDPQETIETIQAVVTANSDYYEREFDLAPPIMVLTVEPNNRPRVF